MKADKPTRAAAQTHHTEELFRALAAVSVKHSLHAAAIAAILKDPKIAAEFLNQEQRDRVGCVWDSDSEDD